MKAESHETGNQYYGIKMSPATWQWEVRDNVSGHKQMATLPIPLLLGHPWNVPYEYKMWIIQLLSFSKNNNSERNVIIMELSILLG